MQNASSEPSSANTSTQAQHEAAGRVLAVIAGGTELPRAAVEAAKHKYKQVCVVRLDPFCEDAFDDVPSVSCKLASVGRAFGFMKRHKVDDVVLIGTVNRAPLSKLGIDFGFLVRLPRFIGVLRGGDDNLLRRIIGLFEVEGFSVIGIDTLLPHLIAGHGKLTAGAPNAKHQRDIATGKALLRANDSFDVGQCVVVQNGHVLAVEAAEGTSQMLSRVAGLKNRSGKGGVMVKLSKARQELRIDRPTIGPDTITQAAAAGLSGIAVQAGVVQIAQPSATIKLADELGVFISGIT